MSNGPENVWRGLRDAERFDRTRLSAPGLKSFHNITEAWGLSVRERCVLLGDPSDQTYRRWMRTVSAGTPITLSKDTLFRISAVLGIHKLLTNLFADHSTAMLWLKGPHQGLVFSGQSPLMLMLNGTQDNLLTVRRYLEAWPYGDQAAQSSPESVRPVTTQDIILRRN
jgi:uncharacterized protein (DUF2384 family)